MNTGSGRVTGSVTIKQQRKNYRVEFLGRLWYHVLMKDKKSNNTGDEKNLKNSCDSSVQSTSTLYTTTMNNTNNLNDTFTPSFTPNIGLAVLLNTGAACFYHLISDTRWNNGEYEVLLHISLGNNYGMSEKEIAEKLAVPERAVKSVITSGKTRLLSALNQG